MFSPLVATYLLKNDISWKGIYVFLSCTCLINVISIIISFWNVDKEVPEEEEILDNVDHREITKAAIFHPMTLLGAAYILVYMGFEVTLGGWGYTFLTEGIYGDPIAMEKVVSCYWMGLAASPILLGYLVSRFGEKLMITLLTLMVLCGMMVLIVSKDIVLDSTGN
jgi:fucose permease